MKKYHVKLTFTQPILGTITKDPEVYKAYIAGKAALTDEALAEELETVEKIEEKGWTGFHVLNGGPILYDYVIKGFFKDACSMLTRVGNTQSAKLKAFRKIIDGTVFIEPRQIPLVLPGGNGMGVLERPLRAQTAQGERVALARSDTCPAGTTMEFDVILLGGVSEAVLREWFDYGRYRGLGQWRNGGYGSFVYEMNEA
jgi:hypothetical protein